MRQGFAISLILVILVSGAAGAYYHERSYYAPGFLGVNWDDVGNGPAAKITGVIQGSPAELAGLRCGDWILAVRVGATYVPLRDMATVARAGDRVTILVARPNGWSDSNYFGLTIYWWVTEYTVRLDARHNIRGVTRC